MTHPTPQQGGAHPVPREDAARADAVASLAERRASDVAPPAGPAFARGLWRIAAADVSSGNAVALLTDGPATYEAMLAAIAASRETVALESYILRSDETGQRFAAALVDAVERGVSVRLLTDWIGMRGIRSSYVADLRRAGVELRVFNAPGLRAWLGLVPRDHRKLLVIDGSVGITGGVGIGDEWMGKTKRHRGHWRDTAVRIEGPAARDMQSAFDTMWQRAQKRERRGSHRLTRRIARGAHLDPATAEPALVGIVEGEPLRLRIARALQIQAISAERSIWIANAYFVPSWSEIEALMGAARDGVDVRILTVSKETDVKTTWWAGRSRYEELLRAGVRVYEYQPTMMHAKTFIVDGMWGSIGSMNFDNRSLAFNNESNLAFLDTALGAQMDSTFLDDLTRSKEITLDEFRQRPWHQRMIENGAALFSRLL